MMRPCSEPCLTDTFRGQSHKRLHAEHQESASSLPLRSRHRFRRPLTRSTLHTTRPMMQLRNPSPVTVWMMMMPPDGSELPLGQQLLLLLLLLLPREPARPLHHRMSTPREQPIPCCAVRPAKPSPSKHQHHPWHLHFSEASEGVMRQLMSLRPASEELLRTGMTTL